MDVLHSVCITLLVQAVLTFSFFFLMMVSLFSVGDEHLSALHLLFDKHFEKACQLVDQGSVYTFVGERSGRRAYQVRGHSSTGSYLVVPRQFCSCQSFFFEVVSKAEAAFCKHQLAVLLAEALKVSKVTHVNDLVIAEILAGF